MIRSMLMLGSVLITSIFGIGCGGGNQPGTAQGPSAAGAAFVLKSEPAGAKGIKTARNDAKDSDEIVVVGRIGGDVNPWVEGQAAFTLVDTQLKPCNENSDDACETPWDYCCDTDVLPKSKAMVKLVDAKGKTVATDARKLLGVKELQTLVVHGRAKRDEAGNLTVLADGVYIKK